MPLPQLVLGIPLAAALLAGCSEPELFDRLERSGELVVLTRNSPTTYYFDNERPTGFDYDLVSGFAQSRGYRLRVKVAFTLEELIEGLESGEAHLAAAGLTLTGDRSNRFLASDSYLTQRPLVVYKSGNPRPRSIEQLVGRDLVVLAGSSHVETLQTLREQLPALSWREIRAADTLELMKQVAEKRADMAIIDSMEFQMQQALFPRLVSAFDLDAEESIVWYLPDHPGARTLQAEINDYLARIETNGDLAALRRRHFGSSSTGSRMEIFTFQRNVRGVLPRWQTLIEDVAAEYQMDWRLLAAIAYQESHWDPTATSPTGVRGMMMLTQATASDLGVADRTDPGESLRGGARFLKDLNRRLPDDIEEPDRTWMALAAYNIGMGHLEDARVLTERDGLDPHLWREVREYLPKLQDPAIYRNVRYGFARGQEAVTYVDNIRHYFSILKLRAVPSNRIAPPIQMTRLLPASWSGAVPQAI